MFDERRTETHTCGLPTEHVYHVGSRLVLTSALLAGVVQIARQLVQRRVVFRGIFLHPLPVSLRVLTFKVHAYHAYRLPVLPTSVFYAVLGEGCCAELLVDCVMSKRDESELDTTPVSSALVECVSFSTTNSVLWGVALDARRSEVFHYMFQVHRWTAGVPMYHVIPQVAHTVSCHLGVRTTDFIVRWGEEGWGAGDFLLFVLVKAAI